MRSFGSMPGSRVASARLHASSNAASASSRAMHSPVVAASRLASPAITRRAVSTSFALPSRHDRFASIWCVAASVRSCQLSSPTFEPISVARCDIACSSSTSARVAAARSPAWIVAVARVTISSIPGDVPGGMNTSASVVAVLTPKCPTRASSAARSGSEVQPIGAMPMGAACAVAPIAQVAQIEKGARCTGALILSRSSARPSGRPRRRAAAAHRRSARRPLTRARSPGR